MTLITVTCDYCGSVNEVAPGFETLTCRKCGAPMRANFAYYPIGEPTRALPFTNALTIVPAWSVVGADLSYWQGAVDFAKLATKVNFVYLRAGYGNDTIDARLVEYINGCNAHGIPYGLYWYVKPGKAWDKHADNFARYSSGDLPPVMDVEETGGLDKQALAGWLEKLVNRYEGVTGKQLAIYSSPGFWNANMPLTNWAKNRRLWVAHWTTAAQPTLPAEWVNINQPRTWTFWQYAVPSLGSEYGVSSAKIDLNRFNGDREAFKAAFGVMPHETGAPVPPPPPPPPPVVELPEYVRTTAWALNLRHSPEVLADNKGGYATLNSRLKVEGESGDWYKLSVWVSKDFCKAE